MRIMDKARARNGMTAVVLFTVAGGMLGLAFASVPLYRLFCQITGFGGTPKIAAAPIAAVPSDRTITVRFDANVSPALPWRFRPAKREMTVRVGETVLAYYLARNQSDAPVTGNATFNVTPYKAAPYFIKVACFCFTEQLLQPAQEVAMPVSFFVDPDIFTDLNTKEIRAITLSYSFFRAKTPADAETPTADAETQDRAHVEAAPHPAAERRQGSPPERIVLSEMRRRERRR